MTIFIDPLFHWPGPISRAARSRGHGAVWCHLMTDELSLENLHQFATRIRLKREWFQNRRGMPHYDLTPGAQERALSAGAVEVLSTQLIRLCRRSGLTRVANIKRGEAHDILVDRSTFWGNHWFHIGPCCSRDQAVDGHLKMILNSPEHLARLHELRGKTLGCHCSPLRCHADNLAFLADFFS